MYKNSNEQTGSYPTKSLDTRLCSLALALSPLSTASHFAVAIKDVIKHIMAQRALPLLLLLFAPVVTSHGHLLRAVIKPKDGGADKVACAANANAAECAGSPSVRLRKLIPRSGNDGACKIPPGCELGCPGVTGSKPGGAPCATLGICDHCGLEKVAAEKTQVGTDGSKSVSYTHLTLPTKA